jgi:uncharacterized protein YdaT
MTKEARRDIATSIAWEWLENVKSTIFRYCLEHQRIKKENATNSMCSGA